jgi:hypothetical protein
VTSQSDTRSVMANRLNLDDLIFQCGDPERSLFAICLRNIHAARWQCSIRPRVHTAAKVADAIRDARFRDQISLTRRNAS